jgi:hypothetical protein
MLLGPCPIARDRVTKGINSLNNLVISHDSINLTVHGTVLQLCLPDKNR